MHDLTKPIPGRHFIWYDQSMVGIWVMPVCLLCAMHCGYTLLHIWQEHSSTWKVCEQAKRRHFSTLYMKYSTVFFMLSGWTAWQGKFFVCPCIHNILYSKHTALNVRPSYPWCLSTNISIVWAFVWQLLLDLRPHMTYIMLVQTETYTMLCTHFTTATLCQFLIA